MKDVTVLKPNAAVEFTPEQLALIKATVARDATNDELKLFLYRCKNMGLDPLKPGMVHFVKYGSNPGSIVVGIDGFRAKAQGSGMHNGTSRGVLRDDKGKCIGAWCEVRRKDWTEPARVEVSLSEYNSGKAMWAKMPESMIQKVAECAALRMAFPDHLSGLYSQEEMDQAEPREAQKIKEIEAKLAPRPQLSAPENVDEPHDLAEYVIKVGKNKGRKLGELSAKDMDNFVKFYEEKRDAGEQMHIDVCEYYNRILMFRELAP